MNRIHIKHALARMNEPIIKEDVSGFYVRRSQGFGPPQPSYQEEEWRLYSGGGIAGNAGVWWMRKVGGDEVRGPYRSAHELDRGVRAWRRWEPEPAERRPSRDGAK